MYQMPAPESDLQPKALPLTNASPLSADVPWTRAPGTSSTHSSWSRSSAPDLDRTHQGQGCSQAVSPKQDRAAAQMAILPHAPAPWMFSQVRMAGAGERQ